MSDTPNTPGSDRVYHAPLSANETAGWLTDLTIAITLIATAVLHLQKGDADESKEFLKKASDSLVKLNHGIMANYRARLNQALSEPGAS